MIINSLFRNCVFREKVEVLFDSVNNSISLVSNKIERMYLLVKNGNADIAKNEIDITQSSINLLISEFINITDNSWKECIKHPKFKFVKSYMHIEKNIDQSLRDYIGFNSNQKTIFQNNTYKCNFCMVD